MSSDFKYIVIQTQIKEDNEVLIPIIFPMLMSHVDMFESTKHLLAMKHGWINSKIVSAGFFNPHNLKCHGKSETLGVVSLGDEDSLLIKSYSMLAYV